MPTVTFRTALAGLSAAFVLLLVAPAQGTPVPVANNIGDAACSRLAGKIGFYRDVRTAPDGKRNVRQIVCVESGPTSSTGRSETRIPPCIPEEPSVTKEQSFGVGAIVALEALVPDGRLIGKITEKGAREFLEGASFATKHEVGKWFGEFSARRFPPQLVASCVPVRIYAPYNWERLHFGSVTLYVRESGDPQWYPCPVHGGECALAKAAWLSVPTARSAPFVYHERMMKDEYFQHLSAEKRAMLEFAAPIFHSTVFVNWSENSARQALLIIEYEEV